MCLSGTDLQAELQLLSKHVFQIFQKNNQPCIYNPDQFRQFCISSGATTIFDNILQSVLTPRKSENRKEKNKKIAVNIIYTLCFALSQQNNYLQQDQTRYFMLKNLNKEALDTERCLGNSCSSRKSYYMRQNIGKAHIEHLNSEIEKAIRQQSLIVCVIDDYHCIHGLRRPSTEKLSEAKHMCTIIIKIFPKIKAIKLPTKMEDVHNPNGISADICSALICSQSSMEMLCQTFATIMPAWARQRFFDPENERSRLHLHDYANSEDIRDLRSMDNVQLLEMNELPLKRLSNFETALTWVTKSSLKQYMQKYLLLVPGDWPAQFYIRQAVYKSVYPNGKLRQPENPLMNTRTCDHHDYSLRMPLSDSTFTTWKKEMDSIVPLIGPLHISLNAREDICELYHPLIKYIYKRLFPGCVLAGKPKPWRITLLLEIIYGGWTLIRSTVVVLFSKCKQLQYAILFNLMDNYIPLVLMIYGVSFKLNQFGQYLKAVVRIWTMFHCFHRKHYDKAPLVWISNIGYWSQHYPELHQTFEDNIACTDEYPVENAHSIIRANTQSADDCTTISKKAKMMFTSKAEVKNFKSVFTPPKSFTFTRKVLKSLKVKAAEIIGDVLKKMTNTDSAIELSTDMQLNSDNIKCLPLGFHTNKPPNPCLCCDMPACPHQSEDLEWKRFDGCFHSFHVKCLGDIDHCPICRGYLQQVVQQLSTSAQNAIFNGQDNAEVDLGNPENNTPDKPPKINEETNEELAAKIEGIKEGISSLKIPVPTLIQHQQVSTKLPVPKHSCPPHCKTCGHPIKGHRTIQASKTCPMCENNKCSPASKNQKCQCEWHKGTVLAPDKTNSSHNVQMIKHNATATELILPKELCQYSLSPNGLTSNACTVIALLTVLSFLQGNLSIPKHGNDSVLSILPKLREVMIEGNTLYSIINPPSHNPNLAIDDLHIAGFQSHGTFSTRWSTPTRNTRAN